MRNDKLASLCLRTAVCPVAEQFMDENGRIIIQPNFFKYVVATV